MGEIKRAAGPGIGFQLPPPIPWVGRKGKKRGVPLGFLYPEHGSLCFHREERIVELVHLGGSTR